MGVEPIRYLLSAAYTTPCVYFTSPSGKAAGMAGVGQKGDIWMLCTPVIYEKPRLFVREAKRYVDNRQEPLSGTSLTKEYSPHQAAKILRIQVFTSSNTWS